MISSAYSNSPAMPVPRSKSRQDECFVCSKRGISTPNPSYRQRSGRESHYRPRRVSVESMVSGFLRPTNRPSTYIQDVRQLEAVGFHDRPVAERLIHSWPVMPRDFSTDPWDFRTKTRVAPWDFPAITTNRIKLTSTSPVKKSHIYRKRNPTVDKHSIGPPKSCQGGFQ